jgi:hypothetical protein
MGCPPSAHPLDICSPVEVIAVLRLVEPAALAGRLARAATLRFGAVPLMAQVAWVRTEPIPAVSTLPSSVLSHRRAPSSTPMIGNCPASDLRKRPRYGTREEDGTKEGKDRKRICGGRKRRRPPTCSHRQSAYSFRTAVRPVAYHVPDRTDPERDPRGFACLYVPPSAPPPKVPRGDLTTTHPAPCAISKVRHLLLSAATGAPAARCKPRRSRRRPRRRGRLAVRGSNRPGRQRA